MSKIVGGSRGAGQPLGLKEKSGDVVKRATLGSAPISMTDLSKRSVSSLASIASIAFQALQDNDIAALKAVFSHASPQTFLKATCNEAGDTLVHAAARDGNLDALVAMKIFSESPITLLENKTGETVKAILDDKGLYAAFRDRLGYDVLGLKQDLVLAKFIAYLEIKAAETPDEYDVEKIIADLSIGHCSGLAIHWMELSMLDRAGEYYTELSMINQWDGTADSLTKELDEKISNFIQLIRFAQQKFHEKAALDYVDDPTLRSEIRAEAEKVIFREITQDKVVNIIGREDKYQSSDILTHYQMLPKFLEYTLNENNTVRISNKPGDGAAGHVIGVKMREGKFYLFDSNHTGYEKNYSAEHSAIEYASISDLMKSMTDSFKISHDNQTVPQDSSTHLVILDKQGAPEYDLSLSNQATRVKLLDPKFRATFKTCEEYCSFINAMERDAWGMDLDEKAFFEEVIRQETIDGVLALSQDFGGNLIVDREN